MEIAVAFIGAGASVIVGILSFVAVLVSNKKANDEMQKKIEIAQAVTDTKIEELTREVREHNNFARRMPVVESDIKHIESDINTLKEYHRGS